MYAESALAARREFRDAKQGGGLKEVKGRDDGREDKLVSWKDRFLRAVYHAGKRAPRVSAGIRMEIACLGRRGVIEKRGD